MVATSRIDVWAVVAGSVVLFLLVVARMHVAIEQIVAANREREQLQDDLAYQATHDSLTGLPNRAQALRPDRTARCSRAQRSRRAASACSSSTSTASRRSTTRFGHRAGDEVLRVVARAAAGAGPRR